MFPQIFKYDIVLFQCDLSRKYGDYKDMNLAWSEEKASDEDGETISRYSNFMILKKGVGYELFRRDIFASDEYHKIQNLPLKNIYESNGGPLPLLTQMLSPIRVYPGSISKTVVDIIGLTEIIRRLTIFGYEEVRTHFQEFRKYDEFVGFTEEQMLRPVNLLKLRKLIEEA